MTGEDWRLKMKRHVDRLSLGLLTQKWDMSLLADVQRERAHARGCITFGLLAPIAVDV